jgi:hypothetical protein
MACPAWWTPWSYQKIRRLPKTIRATWGGCRDVFAWKGDALVSVELKRLKRPGAVASLAKVYCRLIVQGYGAFQRRNLVFDS